MTELRQQRKLGLRFWAGWLTVTQFIALIVAIVHLFHSVTFSNAIVGFLLTWPVKVGPHWLGVVAALCAFMAAGTTWSHFGGGGQAAS